MRPFRGVERDRFAIEHQRVCAERAHHLDDFGHRVRNLVQRACIDAHLVGHLVRLDARAVHLPFECGFASQRFQCLPDVGRRLSEHGCRGHEELELESRERFRSFHQRGSRDRTEALRVHRRSAHFRHRHAGGRGNRLDHHPGECALPKLSDDEAEQEFLLGRRRA